MTAYPIAQLLQDKKATCRHCQNPFTIDPKVLRDVERTLHNMADYVEKKDIPEDFDDPFAAPEEDQPAHEPTDNTPKQAQTSHTDEKSFHTQENKQTTPTKRTRRSKRKNRQPSMANG